MSMIVSFVWSTSKDTTTKTITSLQYQNLASALRPIPHSKKMPVSTFAELSEIHDEELDLVSNATKTDEGDSDLDS